MAMPSRPTPRHFIAVVTHKHETVDRVFAVVDRFDEWQDSLAAADWIKLESERWIVCI